MVAIKLWGPTEMIDQNTSQTLFRKYIEYLSQNITNKILYKGKYFDELLKVGFIQKKEGIYEKAV
jgi:hypothetical protein